MKIKSPALYLSKRFLFRDKTAFFIQTLGVAIFISLIVLSSLSNDYIIKSSIKSEKLNTGNWHVSYLIENDFDISQLKDIDQIETVHKAFFVPQIKVDEYNENISLMAISNTTIDKFIKLDSGRYPNKENEIIVPTWFLEKYLITSLPKSISGDNMIFNIVGCYNSSINAPMIAYSSLEENEYLKKYSVPELPWYVSSNNTDNFTNEDREIKYLCLLTLKENSDLQNLLTNIKDNYQSLNPFYEKDFFGISTEEDTLYPCFNIKLISSQGIKNAGDLTSNSTFAMHKYTDQIIQVVLLSLCIAFVFTFNNINKSKILRQASILKSIGAKGTDLVLIFLIKSSFTYFIAILLGSLIGHLSFCIFINMEFATFTITTLIIGIIAFLSALVGDILSLIYINFANISISLKKESDVKLSAIKTKKIKLFYIFYPLRNIRCNKKRAFFLVYQ